MLKYITTSKLLIITFSVFSQSISPGFKTRLEHKLDFDSIVKNHCPKLEATSYFVITYPTVGASTSWIPQFLDAYNSVKNRNQEIVLVLFNSGGYSLRDIPLFFQNIAGLSKSEYQSLHVIINDDVYNTLTGKRYLVRLQYYFRGDLYYDNAEKWHKSKTLLFPKEHVQLSPATEINLTTPDTILIRLKDPVYARDENNVLILADAKNELLNVDLKSGQTTSLLNISDRFTASELFCKYIVPGDSGRCNYSTTKEASVTQTQRKTISVDGITQIDSINALLVVNIEVLEKNSEEYVFKNDEGIPTKFDVGQPVLNLYTLLAQFNYESKELSFKKLKEMAVSPNHDYYLMVENGTKIQNQHLISSTIDYGVPDSLKLSVVDFIASDSLYTPILSTPRNIYDSKLDMFYTKSFFYNFAGQIYFSYNCSPHIYVLGRSKLQSSFIGNGKAPQVEEKFPKFLEDTTETLLNFRIHNVETILDGEFLCAFINYQNSPTIEIKNRMLKTVDVLDLSQYPEFANYNSCTFREDIFIKYDRIFMKKIDENGLKLVWWDINKLDK